MHITNTCSVVEGINTERARCLGAVVLAVASWEELGLNPFCCLSQGPDLGAGVQLLTQAGLEHVVTVLLLLDPCLEEAMITVSRKAQKRRLASHQPP